MELVVRIIGVLSLCAIPIGVTALVTAYFCRRAFARKKRASYGTVLMGGSCVPGIVVVLGTLLDPGVWWSREHKMTPEIALFLLACLAAMSFLSALAVVVYYEFRSKHDETGTA